MGRGLRGRGTASPSFVAAGLLKFPESCAIPSHQVAFSCQGVFSMSRIAAGPAAEGAEQRQESSGKERTVGLLLALLVALMTCGFSTLDNAATGSLQRRDGHRSMAQSAADPQRSGGGLRVRREEPPVHGADHVLRDDALHHRPVTAAGWPFGWGCCWQALWVRRRSRCTNSGKSSGNDPSAAIRGTFLIAETACRFWQGPADAAKKPSPVQR